ncbi:acyltransferase [Sphingomicrobium flavum]|uniref:acyltransferase n=1 Tax=Sphingomicrobium flavum TaxID=1229164 RepID=UPI0021ADDE02|nr:acyltransferase [Sphingomicrobium flavum]
MKYFLIVTAEVMSTIIFSLPRYRLFNAIKAIYLNLVWGAKIGRRVIFYSGVRIFPGQDLVIGDDVNISKGCQVYTKGGVTIGDRTMIGFNTIILAGNHHVPPGRQRMFGKGFDRSPVTIGPDVWIGCNCSILAGATIGEGAIVAAGSVVSKNVEPFTIVGGVPAKKIRDRA